MVFWVRVGKLMSKDNLTLKDYSIEFVSNSASEV